MAIEWDALVVEMTLLGALIYGAIYVETWIEKRNVRQKEKAEARHICEFVANDLRAKLRFIEDTIQYKDFKPFFTDMWDAVILGGRQATLPFDLFEKLQHTYSWMKYYNNELEQIRQTSTEVSVTDTLKEVRDSINQSLVLLSRTRF